LVTGANSGIGKAIANAYKSRSNKEPVELFVEAIGDLAAKSPLF